MKRQPRSAVPHPPTDPALPNLQTLLDTDVVAEHLCGWLADGATIEEVEPRQIDYEPGRHCVMQWRVWIAGRPYVAVARIDADATTTRPRSVNATSGPLSRVSGWDGALEAAVHWYPYDPAMPALAAVEDMLIRIGRPPVPAAGFVDLAYRPGVRAARRAGDVVLKWYAAEDSYRRALDGFAWTRRHLGERTPALLGCDADARCIAQTFVDGAPVRRAESVDLGAAAGRVLRDIHRGSPVGVAASLGPANVLRQAERTASLLRALLPGTAEQINRLVSRLIAAAPTGGSSVVAHGDFNASQILRRADGTLTVLDFDEMRLAPPAYDLAAFVANVAGGRPGDREQARSALDAVLQGYGKRPNDVTWYLAAALLGRARSAFRLQKSKWPARLAAGVALAEDALTW